MTYVEKTIGKGEKIIAVAQISKWPVLFWGIVSLGLFYLTAAGFRFDLSGLVAGLIIAVAVVSKPLITAFSTELAATNRRIVGKTGFFRTKTLDLPIKRINSVYVDQKLLGKILNYSTVNVSSASGMFQYNMVKNAEGFRQMVSELIDAYETGGAVPEPVSRETPVRKSDKTCKGCGASIPEEAVFCPKCGRAADKPEEKPVKEPEPARRKTCAHCGALIENDAVFCSACGADTRSRPHAETTAEETRAPEPRKKRCANCGSLVEEAAVFCPACGKKTDGSDRETRLKPMKKGFSVPKDLD